MKIYLVRHGEAEELSASGDDESRELTERGWKRARRAMRGLARIATIDVVLTSPLVRARETADLVAEAFDLDEPDVARELAPLGDPRPLLERLARAPQDASVALVGHMPHLSELAALLAIGESHDAVELGKPGVAMLRGDPAPGAARLEWILAPKILRKLAE